MHEYLEYGLVAVFVSGAAACFLRRLLAMRGGRVSCGCGKPCAGARK